MKLSLLVVVVFAALGVPGLAAAARGGPAIMPQLRLNGQAAGGTSAAVASSSNRNLHLLPKNPMTPHALKTAISGIRGGAAIDHKRVAATLGASILSLYGTACALTPDGVVEGYGVQTRPELTQMVLNSALLTCAATFVIWALLYFPYQMSVHQAVGIAAIPYVLRSLQNIVTQSPAMVFGGSLIFEYIGLAVSSLAVYATLTDFTPGLADLAMKAFAAMQVLPGLVGFTTPKNTFVEGNSSTGGNSGKVKKGKNSQQEIGIVTLLNRNYGNNLMINGTFFAALALCGNVYQAFACCWFLGGAGMAWMALTDMKTYTPTAVGPTFIWVVICWTTAAVMIM